jgi:hypothetical protein
VSAVVARALGGWMVPDERCARGVRLEAQGSGVGKWVRRRVTLGVARRGEFGRAAWAGVSRSHVWRAESSRGWEEV